MEQLRGKVNELQVQNLELQGSSKRQAIGVSSPIHRPGPRLQEDFVPMCNEDIVRWMQDRQADVHEATMAGNAQDGGKVVPCHGGIPDLQCAWILLLYCAAARPNYMLRVVHPTLHVKFCGLTMTPPSEEHSASCWQHHQPTCSGMSPVSHSPLLTSGAAYWASWADSLHMIKERHPVVANQILHELAHHQEAGFHVVAASNA